MKELLRSNDPVLLSFASAVLRGEGIEAAVLDTHMSVLEGSIGAIPRRLMVGDDDYAAAHRALSAVAPQALGDAAPSEGQGERWFPAIPRRT